MMKRLTLIGRLALVFAWVGVVLFLSLAALNVSVSAQAIELTTLPPGLRVIQSDQDRVVLDLTVPEYALRETPLAARPFQQMVVTGAATLAVAGKPELPKFSALLGIPAEGRVFVQVLQDSAQRVTLSDPLLPAATPLPSAGDLQPGTAQRIPDRAAYASAEFYPAEAARLVETAWLRDQHLARVELYPFQYQASTGTVIWHQHLRIEVRFEKGRTSDRPATTPTRLDPFEPLLQQNVLNYDVARGWRSDAAAPRVAARTTTATPRYKIVVDHDGLYRVTYNDLLAAGLVMTSFDPRNLHVTNQGLDVAVEVLGEADGQFDPGDVILFYGQRFRGDLLASRHSTEADDWITLNGWQPQFNARMVEKYTDDNVYWLDVGATPGLRMTAVDGTPADAPLADYYTATVHVEQQNLWKTTTFSGEDTWFWQQIYAYVAATYPYTTPLTALATVPVSATVHAEAAPIAYNPPASPNAHIQFRLNTPGNLLADLLVNTTARVTMTAQVPQAALLEGSNTLSLTVLTSNLEYYFDWFEIQYARRFQANNNQLTFADNRSAARQYAVGNFTTETLQILDITNPWQPQRVTSSTLASEAGLYTTTFQIMASVPVTYFIGGADRIQAPKQLSRYVPADLTDNNGADYLIITHRDFMTAMQTLADYRAADGLRVKIIDVDDLYNQFTDGIYHPIAIKDFLRYAYADWQRPAPTYVLLVGDGHWNFKNFNPARYGTPPNFMPPNLGWVDPYQGEVDTANELVTLVGNDPLPDMLVGRLPVNTAAEASSVVSKIISYESQAKSLPYLRHMLFVADNVPDPKNAGDFVQFSENLINQVLPAAYQPDRIYANNYSCPPGANSCPLVNYAITSTLNTTSALFVNYIGHASLNRWGDESFFVNANIAGLNNLDRLPIILSMTCLDGYWIYPSNPGLMETMLRATNGGSVASFSPTGLGVSTGHDRMERGLLDAVFSTAASRLGTAALASKVALFDYGQDHDLIDTFTVFGDPALHLPTYDLAVAPKSSVRFGSPHSVVVHTFQLTNTSWLTNTAFLSMTGNTWASTVPPTLTLLPGAVQSLQISVSVPMTVSLGALDVATVTLRSGSGDQQAVLQLATINGLYGITTIVAPFSQTADPGTVVTYTFQVANLGVLTDSFSLSSMGNTWLTHISDTSLNDLPPQGRAIFTVTVLAPTHQVAYSRDVAQLVVASQGSLSFVSTVTPLTTTLKPVYGFAVDPRAMSRVSVSGQSVVYPLTITNTGNVTNTFVTNVSGALWPTVISATIGPLAPWASSNVPVRVNVPVGVGRRAMDTATITLTMALGGSLSDSISLITLANPYQVVLPLMLKSS